MQHDTACCAYADTKRTDAEGEARAERQRIAAGKDHTNTKPEYAVGQRVRVMGWTRESYGTITDIARTYHCRLYEWVWGYKILYEDNGPGLTLVYVPEGYLRKS